MKLMKRIFLTAALVVVVVLPGAVAVVALYFPEMSNSSEAGYVGAGMVVRANDAGTSFSKPTGMTVFEESEALGGATGLPYASANEEWFLHIGLGYLYAQVDASILRYSTGPETIFSPKFVDTVELAADSASTTSIELGYKQGRMWLISEYLLTDVDANDFDDPTFDGFMSPSPANWPLVTRIWT